MGRPINEYPKISYRVEALIPESVQWTAITGATRDRPSSEAINRALSHINGLRAKGSPKIESIRIVEITQRVVNEGPIR